MDKNWVRAIGVIQAFRVLGTNAEAAIPHLSRFLVGSKSNEFPVAAFALMWIGEKGLPPLMLALTNTTPPNKKAICDALGQMGTNARPAIPLLLTRLAPNGAFSADAWSALRNLGLDMAAPAVIARLEDPNTSVRHETLIVLSHAPYNFGQTGTNFIPALRLLLATETNSATRDLITNALQQVET